MFTSEKVFPGIWQITDEMGVSMTLVEGRREALLADAGYGTEDVAADIRTLTDRPVCLLLTHGHHDHALGAAWFPESRMCAEDMPVFRLRTARAQREAVREQAEGKGIRVPDSFLTAPIPDPEPLEFPGTLGGFPCRREDLGGREVWVLHLPLHTPGSVVIAVPEYGLLLTGDDWNPCTWLWFAESCGVLKWRREMKKLIPALEAEMGKEIGMVLCSHQGKPRTGAELKAFLEYMTEERIRTAPAVDMNSPIRTRQAGLPEKGWVLVFDGDRTDEQ